MLAIVRKELADLFNSMRFFILFILVLLASAGGLYVVQQGIRAALEQSQAVTHGGFIFLAIHAVFGELVKHGRRPVLVNFASGLALIAVLKSRFQAEKY